MVDEAQIAARALACLDLTDLSADSDAAAIRALCERAETRHGPVAAICIWPRFVGFARGLLPAPIRLATVVNFPGGDAPLPETLSETRAALADGADEIDMVIPYRALRAGNTSALEESVREVKEVCGAACLKAILETGELDSAELIRAAAEGAIAGGADFIKTSTGKTPVSATPEAAHEMLTVIAARKPSVGLKPSGGIKTTADAGRYLALCDEVMGSGWATPETFRLGASGVLDELLATLGSARG